MSLSRVTVLYSENKLQTTIKFPSSTTVADVKRRGSEDILNHLRNQPGVSETISIDDDRTEFHPDAQNTARMRDVKSPVTMVVWPKTAPGSQDFRPSPVMDALNEATTDLANARSQLSAHVLIEEENQDNQWRKSKPGSSSIPPSNPSNGSGAVSTSSSQTVPKQDSTLDTILSRLALIEASNRELKDDNTALVLQLEETNAKLEETNAKLEETDAAWKLQVEETNARLQTTMRAVFGDRVAINKIRNRVLLDMGRNKLAVICGHKDWKAWKASGDSRDAMVDFASTQLNTLDPIDDKYRWWNDLGKQHTALQTLLLRNRIRDRGDLAAHGSAKECIGESVLALTVERERMDMMAIFQAVFSEEPVH